MNARTARNNLAAGLGEFRRVGTWVELCLVVVAALAINSRLNSPGPGLSAALVRLWRSSSAPAVDSVRGTQKTDHRPATNIGCAFQPVEDLVGSFT